MSQACNPPAPLHPWLLHRRLAGSHAGCIGSASLQTSWMSAAEQEWLRSISSNVQTADWMQLSLHMYSGVLVPHTH